MIINVKKAMLGIVTAGLVVSSVVAQDEVEKKNWELSVNAGANFSSGNTKNYLANAGAAYKQTIGMSEIKTGFNMNYGEIEKTNSEGTNEMVKDTDKYNIYGEYQYNISERYFVNAIADWMHDYKADIKYRYKIGPNVGVNLIKDGAVELQTSVGAVYLYETYETEDGNDDYIALRLAEDFLWTISEGTKLIQGVEYMPDTSEFGKYLVNFNVSLEAPVAKGISMVVTFKDQYNSQPVDDKKKNDTSLIFGLQYSL
ncbi:MAG: DUF481 domain-containing protein [Kiritimatiellae bacterium]|nr:DUF481 domain-containing protein [Kiritimatiellia bacterium]